VVVLALLDLGTDQIALQRVRSVIKAGHGGGSRSIARTHHRCQLAPRGCKAPPGSPGTFCASPASSKTGGRVQSDVMESDSLAEVAGLLHERNRIDARIAQIVQRPMTAGHLGEWIASRVFDIELEVSASAAAIDGRFRAGALASPWPDRP
jgi:hypothetical protein